MDLAIAEHVVVVTGGAKGIGEAIVRALAAEGAIPIIVDRDEPAARTLEAEIRGQGRSCDVLVGDLADPGICEEVATRATTAWGHVNGLINNAGINDGIALTGSPDDFVASLHRNLVHYYALAHYLRPALAAARGSIVNIASKVAVTGQGGTSGYAAAKGAILALTREWAVDLLADGVRVNAVVPAEVMTPLYEQWLATFPNPEEKRAAIERRIPLGGRMTTPDEIAAMVVFLLSPKAGHVTGQHVFVDGGYTHLDRSAT